MREELAWNSWSPARQTNDSVVAFPSLTCLAATWNLDMATAYGSAISEEWKDCWGATLLSCPSISARVAGSLKAPMWCIVVV